MFTHRNPCHNCLNYCASVFAAAGPTVWNSLPDNLRDSDVTANNFNRSLKSFRRNSAISALVVLRRCAKQIYISLTYTFLLTDIQTVRNLACCRSDSIIIIIIIKHVLIKVTNSHVKDIAGAPHNH